MQITYILSELLRAVSQIQHMHAENSILRAHLHYVIWYGICNIVHLTFFEVNAMWIIFSGYCCNSEVSDVFIY